MHLVPVGFRNQPVVKLSISSVASISSASFSATAGTGLVRIPVYAWICASVAGMFACYNGTAGSLLFRGRATAGGVNELQFWESPGAMAQGKQIVIETTGEVGIHDFHLYCIVARGGVGTGATNQ
jgi:hypothetical protein